MANSNSTMFQTPLEGNDKDHVLPWSEKELQDMLVEKSAEELKDIADGKVMQHTTVKEEALRQNWLKGYKPKVYDKMIKYPEKIANGESIAIIQFQYDYLCNFDCEHCCIDKFYVPKNWEDESGRRKFELEDVRRLADEADAMGLANFVITGGEPLLLKEFDELVEAIGPDRFYLVTDSNGWNLDLERAKHLKAIGVDKVQLSLDGADEESHDTFRRAPGSWKRVMRAIDACKEADLHVILSTVIWKDRIYTEEWRDFLDYAKSKDVGTYVVYAKPVGAYEGVTEQMMTEKEGKILQQFEEEYDIFTHMTPSYGRDIGCIAVKRMVPVTRYGDILPCPYQHVSLGNFFEEPLADIIGRGLNIKWFDPRKNMPCICGVDKGFIENVISESYGDSEVPVRYDKVFTSDDFMNQENMGDVEKESGSGEEVETWVNAPLITLKGSKLKKFDAVEDSIRGA
jgi:MoaA/NifB/PqqE/SkfB family radical SAM enzyme|tara:strand:+ start:1799 stop:3166 length:1368 start_codon:yes stop_codon:yes gene_type:complete